MKTAASKKVAPQRVHELISNNGRREFLDLSTPDNRLLLTIESRSRSKPNVREVTLAESFAWYEKSHAPLWWDDGSPGPAWPAWLGMVAANLKRAPVDLYGDEAGSYRKASSCLPPELSWPDLDRQLVIKGGQIYLSRCARQGDLYFLTPCTFAQAVAWCRAMRALHPQDGAAENLLLDYACNRLIPFTDDEMAKLKQAADLNHRGNVVEFTKAWMAESCRAEIQSGKLSP